VAEESTTPDLEALTQRLLDATNARDFDAVISLYAPEAVWDTTETFGVFQGRQAIRGFLEEWIGTYEEVEFEVEERRNLGHDVIFAVVKTRGRLPGSTGWIHLRYASVVTWVGGLIERSAAYRDIDEGRAAAERLAEERG